MRVWPIAFVLFTVACEGATPLQQALPALPPTGGPAIAAAGVLTDANFAKEHVDGPASQGLVGDFFMRNDKVRVIVQAPGRAIGPCPYGGNIIDFDFVEQPAGDQLGEVSAMMQLGRTVNAQTSEVVRDGAQGGPAVLQFTGRDAWDDFINLAGLGELVSFIKPENLPAVALNWQIAETYILMPGDTSVRVLFTFYNPSKDSITTSWGTLSDSGSNIQFFQTGLGYGEVPIASLFDPPPPPVDYMGLQGVGTAYGVMPVFADPTTHGAGLLTSGVGFEIYGVDSVVDGFSDTGKTLTIAGGGVATREVRVMIGRDLADVDAQVHALRNEPTVAIAGAVLGTSAAGARVAAQRVTADGTSTLETTFTADANGNFSGALPSGHYLLQAEGASFVRSPVVAVDVPGAGVALHLPPLVPLRYTIHDRNGVAIPGKIMAIGAQPNAPSAMFRDVTREVLPPGFVDWAHSLVGKSTDTPDPLSHADRALALPAGHYRIVVSHGPEWSIDDRQLDVAAPGAQVDAVLDHVVPTPGYAACDFHQHSHKSSDSQIEPETRVLSYVAEGVDFASTSEHDFVWDLKPVQDEVGATGLFDTAIGVETTTWDYGHYIGWPLVPDSYSPNGGAPDWAGGQDVNGAEGLDLPPPMIFDKLRAAGAQVVQVTHPRGTSSSTNYQSSFDRSGLTYDFKNHAFGSDLALLPVSLEILGLPPDATMFGTGFDTLEVYNGYNVITVNGERVDQKAENVMRDWMNFLSFGFLPTAVGVSDTHTRVADPAGMPRTLVAIADDSPRAIAAGIGDDVMATLKGKGVPKDVIVTNGPLLAFTVDGSSIGRTVTHTTNAPLAVHIEVHSPAFTVVDTVEVFANATFEIPSAMAEPLPPVLCFTSLSPPSARCADAIGGARPLVVSPIQTVAGVASSTRLDIVIDTTLDIADVVALNRAGAVGRDLWMVARASGSQALYPSLPSDVAASVDSLVAGTPITTSGVPPFAFTNPIFVDADGNGWRAPFSP